MREGNVLQELDRGPHGWFVNGVEGGGASVFGTYEAARMTVPAQPGFKAGSPPPVRALHSQCSHRPPTEPQADVQSDDYAS